MAQRGSFLSWPAERPRLSRILVFALGMLYTACFAPFNLWPLLPLVLVPLLYIWLTVSPRDAAGFAFWFGFGLFLSGTYWVITSIVGFGKAPLPLGLALMLGLVLIMALWMTLTGWLVNRLADGERLRLLWVAPAAWVGIEWLRGFMFTGFPWLAAGYSQVDAPLAGYAPAFGVYGVSFVAVFSSAALVYALLADGRQRLTGIGLAMLPWVGGLVLGFVSWTEPLGEPVRTTILQAGISQDEKWQPEQLQPTMDFYRGGTAAAADSPLVVWPEVAIPTRGWQQAELADFVRTLRRDTLATGQTVAFGIFQFASERGERHVYNSVALLHGNEPVSFYRKRHLVPFGEYFPVPDFVRAWMRGISLDFADISAGAEDQPLLETRGGVKIATAICYEDAYGAEQRYAFPEASIIVNVSNDGWFGESIAPHQHLQIARMRSLEVGRPTVRSTNNGISAFIDARGRLLERGPQFQPSALTRDVQPRRGATPYVKWGNLPVVALSLLLLALSWFRDRR